MRGGSHFRPPTTEKKSINAYWRGIGCLIIGVFMFGGYYVTGLLIDWLATNPIPGLPNLQMADQSFGPWPIPGMALPVGPITINYIQLMVTVVVVLVGYSIMSIVYTLINPPKLGPNDAPPIHRKIDKSKVR
jgi:hypothetical protein